MKFPEFWRCSCPLSRNSRASVVSLRSGQLRIGGT
jgi:hypothetical protein